MTTRSMAAWTLACVVLVAAVLPVAADEPPGAKRGLHLPRTRNVSFTVNLRDGAGNQWDLQSGMNVGQGTNYIFSGGLRCQVQGSQVRSTAGGWGNAAGDEIEIGPHPAGSIQVYRRCKVYADKPLARWLDILVNTSSTKQTVPVRIYSYVNTPVSGTITSSGGNTFGEKDWAFVTMHGGGRPNLLHIVCGPRSKVRPTIQTANNQISVSYQVTIPPGGTAVLCYFASQSQDAAALRRLMDKKLVANLLRDLSPSVRRLIVNFHTGDLLEEIELQRSGAADTVVLSSGDCIQGLIANESFALASLHGELKLPAGQVVGLVSVAGRDDLVRVVLVNGQVITGRLAEPSLKVVLPTGGELNIPCAGSNSAATASPRTSPTNAPSPTR